MKIVDKCGESIPPVPPAASVEVLFFLKTCFTSAKMPEKKEVKVVIEKPFFLNPLTEREKNRHDSLLIVVEKE